MTVDFAFIDSGTGGIPYMLYLAQKYPGYSSIYVADTENFPYGEKTHDEIIRSVSDLVHRIVSFAEPKVIIIACNTISVTALETLRKSFPYPFVGTVPAVKLARTMTKNNKIGLLATMRTVQEAYTDKLISDFASDCQVFKRGDSDLVTFVEKEYSSASIQERKKALEPAVSFFTSCGTDTIILACTHFIHLTKEMQEMCGSSVSIIDSREGVVKQAMRLLEHETTSNEQVLSASCSREHKKSSYTFYFTGDRDDQTLTSYFSLMKNFGVSWGGKLL